MLEKLNHGCLDNWSEHKDEKLSQEHADFVPRDYQIEMLNRAKKENTIVMMPTGSGKTYVAVLLIKHYMYQVMTDPWIGNHGDPHWKRTFFLVNQVTLVSQQARVLERHTGVSVGQYSGSHCKSIDTWDERTWFHEFKKHQILVMTSEIFKNILSTGFLKTDHVNLLVLDECHHAKENHPMAVIMRDYWNTKKPDGRILGLTASVIDRKKVSGKTDLEASIERLRKTLNARLVTPLEFVNQIKGIKLPDHEIQQYSNENYGSELLEIASNLFQTMESYQVKSLPETEQSTYSHIKKIVAIIPQIICDVGVDSLLTLLDDERGYIAEIGNYLAAPNIAPIEDQFGNTHTCVTYNIGLVVLNQLKILKNTTHKVIENFQEVRMSPKFYDLLKYILKLQYTASASNDQVPRIIIFVERRRIVIAMYKYFNQLRKNVEGSANLKASYVLGGTTGDSEKEGIEDLSAFEILELQNIKKQQEQALLDFREGKSNILLATSVVEEGLDIPACNVVIRYDFPQTYRAYVQSRGRARQSPAKFTFFIAKTDVPEKKMLLERFNDIEMLLQKYASDQSPSEFAVHDDDLDESEYNSLIPPLEVEGTGAKVTATSAIQRLNFYCSQLPKDEYTDVMPTDFTVPEQGSFRTTITLPKLCPVKGNVRGDLMSNKKLAKMSAAMKVLEVLYKAKELTDALLPQFRQKESNPLLIMSEDGRSSSVDQKLKIPTLLWRKDLKEECGHFYLYSIQLTLEPTVDDFAEYFVHGKDHRVACFGILSKSKLPIFPLYNVHPHFGTVTVSIRFEREITVPVHVLPTYFWFQEALFKHILDIKFVDILPEALFKNYFVLPLCWKVKGLQVRSSNNDKSGCLEIDTRFIAQLKKQWDSQNNHWIFGNMPEELDKCLDSVIFPAYSCREDEDNRQISGQLHSVIKISEITARDEMRGGSSNAELETQTYEEYHLAKHNIRLQDPSDNLLECRYVTRHYDFLRPKDDANKKYSKSTMLYIAEIHKVHPMPASLWSQATCLPSILWRMETFCLSKELTETVYRGYSLNISLLASHYDIYFNEKFINLMPMLRRDLEFQGEIDWLETMHAITHKSCQEPYSLERLEFLGDRFLKFVSTLFYFRTMPEKHEGWLSKYRSQLVSNQNLAIRSCKEINLPRFILNKKVDPKAHWIPPCFLPTHVIDKLENEEDVKNFLQYGSEDGFSDALLQLCEMIPDSHLQRLEIKDIADSMEALLGLCVAKYGYRKGVDLLDNIKITTFQATGNSEPKLFKDHLYEPTPLSQICSLPQNVIEHARSCCKNLRGVEKALNYTFKEPLYLLEALTHASYDDIDTCYQRLEFLGDAILDVLMVFHLYEHKPEYDQGKMSDLLSSLVCNTTLSKICTKLQLHKALLYNSVELYNVLARFYMNFDDEKLQQWCEDLSLDRVFVDSVESDTPEKIHVMDLESKIVQTPKLLGDLLESVIGAIYLDCGEDVFKVWEVIWPWFEHFYTAYSKSPPKNPKALVNEAYPGLKRETASYPGDHYRFIATITIAIRNNENRVKKYEFKTIGRERETAMEVSYGRAWHFHKKYLANGPL